MSATSSGQHNMQHLSTAFLIFALVVAVPQDGVKSELVETYDNFDQVAEEGKNRAVTIIDGPKLVPQSPPVTNSTQKPEQRPPSKPPIPPSPEKPKPKYVELPRIYYGQIQNLPPLRQSYNKPLKIQAPNSIIKYHKVIPLQPVRNQYPPNKQKPQQLVFAASTSKPSVASKPPKFNLPIETINGIRADFVRPPHFVNLTTTTTSTTTPTTTTKKYLRTKRIWPKRILEKKNATTSDNETSYGAVLTQQSTSSNSTSDLNAAASRQRYVYSEKLAATPRPQGPSTRPPYRKVTRVPKKKPSTPPPANYTTFEPNDWVPIVPSHFTINKVRKFKQTPISRRSDSDVIYFNDFENPSQVSDSNKRLVFLQSFGLVPMASSPHSSGIEKRNVVVINKKKALKSNVSGYRKKPVDTAHVIRNVPIDESEPNFITKIKHHHHHHHHRYVKTVEKPVKVEVPKPVPVPMPVPVPVKIEKKVPYPVQVKVPHPVPVKVVEKQYVPKPYPVYQQVPVYKTVEVKVPQPVPYPVEKQVPYPVEVQVPVEKHVPVPVTVEKRVPYPVPVKIFVPQPYPVETKVPYPVKEPVEVVKYVTVKVPDPQPYPVRVPVRVPYPVEKRVPYPVEVEKRVPVPVPYKVPVPERVEVEKRVPVYIPKPYPVEKKVPVPVKVPYPVRVPIRVPVGVPIFVHPSLGNDERVVNGNMAVDDGNNSQFSQYSYSYNENSANGRPQSVTQIPESSVTFHGNGVTDSYQTVHGGYNNGFQSRSDFFEDTTHAVTNENVFSTTESDKTQTELPSYESYEIPLSYESTEARSIESNQIRTNQSNEILTNESTEGRSEISNERRTNESNEAHSNDARSNQSNEILTNESTEARSEESDEIKTNESNEARLNDSQSHQSNEIRTNASNDTLSNESHETRTNESSSDESRFHESNETHNESNESASLIEDSR